VACLNVTVTFSKGSIPDPTGLQSSGN